MGQGEYAAAALLFQESIVGYPHPTALRRLGICLLLDRRPADAVLYLAAAVTLSNPSRRIRPLLLLAKAVLTAGNGPRCAKLLRDGVEDFPEVLRKRVVDALRDRWKRADLHRLLDELLGALPEDQDIPGADKDPSVQYGQLAAIYRL
jgi:hypothetical protein